MVTWTFLQQILFSRFIYDFSVPWFQGMSVQITSHSSHTSPADSDIPDRFIFLACEWSLELSTWCCCFCEASIIARIKPFLFKLDSDSSLKSFKLMLNCSRKRSFPVASAVTKLWQTKLFPINIQWFLFLINKNGLAILLEYRVQTMGPRSRLHISKSTKIASRLRVPQIGILPTWIAHRSAEGAC